VRRAAAVPRNVTPLPARPHQLKLAVTWPGFGLSSNVGPDEKQCANGYGTKGSPNDRFVVLVKRKRPVAALLQCGGAGDLGGELELGVAE
jgi:hypothetical protein